MIIHTKNIINIMGINFLEEGKETKRFLNGESKIKISLIGGRKTTNEIYKKVDLSPRAIRKCLLGLERKKEVKRIKGKEINKKVRYCDSWLLKRKENIIKKVPKGKIFAYYKTNHHNGGYRQHHMFFPKNLLLNRDSLSAIGFFDAEGSKTDPKVINVVNSEPKLINLFINFLNYFNISKKNLSYQIIFNKKLPYLLKRSSEKINLASLKFWREKVRIPTNKNIKLSYVGKLKGKSRKRIIKYGSLNINYNSVLFRNFFFKLIEASKDKIKKEEEIIAYLGGYFCGEAYVGKFDREIQIASKDISQLEFIQKILEKVGVNSSVSKETSTSPTRIIITNLKSFLILEDKNVFRFHPNKEKDLITKILNYKKLDKSIRNKLNKKLSLIKTVY